MQERCVKEHFVGTPKLSNFLVLSKPETTLRKRTMLEPNKIVTLVSTFASLLSGSIDQCQNATDETCVGGMASVSAHLRYDESKVNLTLNTTDRHDDNENVLVIPRVDTQSPFAQMHPLGWSVNQVVLQEIFGWRVFASAPSLVTNDGIRDEDLAGLQSETFPLLLTNVALSPSNSWFQYIDAIYFDQSTHLAVLSITPANQKGITTDQLQDALGCLDYIKRLNDEIWRTTLNFFTGWSDPLWIPIVYYAQPNSVEKWETFRDGLLAHDHPPKLILEIEGNAPDTYGVPTMVNNTWIASYRASSRVLHKFELETTRAGNITNIALTETSLRDPLNETHKDTLYEYHISELRKLADDALKNDPLVGMSGFVPLTRDDGDTRVCMGGECVIGNLFTDALRWYTAADLAFVTSGGLRGKGWEAGEVHVSDIWDALPFPNNVCQGVMSGISLFKLLNYSTSVATFQSTYTAEGDRLLQISGVKYTYNTEWNSSRLVDIQVWDSELESYEPIERLRLYKFATDSFLCGIFDPFPDLLADFTLEGEVPGEIDDDSLVHQYIVANYLTNLSGTYDTALQGRLSNDTSATQPLNLVQTKDTCPKSTTWKDDIQSCIACPESSENVAFSDEKIDIMTERGEELHRRVLLVNREVFDVAVKPKVVPNFVFFTNFSASKATTIRSGGSLVLDVAVNTTKLGPGTAQGIVSFSVIGEAALGGCQSQDARFDIFVRITPDEELNQLGNLAYVGFGLAAVVMLTSVFFAIFVTMNRKERILTTLQPPFLLLMCLGLFILGSAIIPYSIDDGLVPVEGADIACAASPWLLSMGFTVAFSGLFSKLWRINQLFDPNVKFQRVKIRAQDVVTPFIVLFVLNVASLTIWTILDPWQFHRDSSSTEPWISHGECRGEGPVSGIMLGITTSVNVCALALACWQAWRARNISSDFSESRYLGMALMSWAQTVLVGGPVIFLLEQGSTVRYFLMISIIFTSCMSMLLLIFVPIFLNLRNHKSTSESVRSSGRHRSIHVSGVSSNGVARSARARQVCLEGSTTKSSNEEEDELRRQLTLLEMNVSQLRERNWQLQDRNGELQSMLEKSGGSGKYYECDGDRSDNGSATGSEVSLTLEEATGKANDAIV